ncbi:hypothetical protein ACLK1S_18915 [Escherichia coli]
MIQSLRNMKGMIAREVRRRWFDRQIKLGAGGIREIEFIVQVFQLIRGGREPSLQSRLYCQRSASLPRCICFLKTMLNNCEWRICSGRLESLLESTTSPTNPTLPSDELNRARLAWAMDFADWPQLTGALPHI